MITPEGQGAHCILESRGRRFRVGLFFPPEVPMMTLRRSLLPIALLLALLIAVVPGGEAYDRVTGRSFASRSEVIAEHGMAATSQPLATQVALDILKAGGSAVDAAIAANATLGLMEPTGSGVGGDLFAIVWDAKTKQLYGLNASGRSPAAATPSTRGRSPAPSTPS